MKLLGLALAAALGAAGPAGAAATRCGCPPVRHHHAVHRVVRNRTVYRTESVARAPEEVIDYREPPLPPAPPIYDDDPAYFGGTPVYEAPPVYDYGGPTWYGGGFGYYGGPRWYGGWGHGFHGGYYRHFHGHWR